MSILIVNNIHVGGNWNFLFSSFAPQNESPWSFSRAILDAASFLSILQRRHATSGSVR